MNNSSGRCPIAGIEIFAACEVHACMNNRAGLCVFQETLQLEGQLEDTTLFFGVTAEQVTERVRDINIGVVAAAWFDHINNKPLSNTITSDDIDAAVDPQQAAEFVSWNRSAYRFVQIMQALHLMRTRLLGATC